jgi:trimeric autotransporter adhesin
LVVSNGPPTPENLYGALRVERGIGEGYAHIVGGSGANSVYLGQFLRSNIIAGGGAPTAPNEISYSQYATISGGVANTIRIADFGVIGGGESNYVNGSGATVPGGTMNAAYGNNSFAAGRNAIAQGDGEFVWNSSDGVVFNPSRLLYWGGDTTGTVNMRASRGFSFTSNGGTQCTLGQGTTGWNCASDRSLKDKITMVNPRAILEKVANLPISTWVMTGYEALHMGPMAQDFRSAFGLGSGDKMINSTDAQGVALAAIQGLNQKLIEQAQQIKAKDHEIAKLKAKYDADIAAIKKKLGM